MQMMTMLMMTELYSRNICVCGGKIQKKVMKKAKNNHT